MSRSLALQKALRAAFAGSAGVLALVPAANIVDTNRRPAPSPAVVLGEEYGRPDDGNVGRDRVELFHDLHIWAAGQSTEGVKRIMGALRAALRLDPRPVLEGGYYLADWEVWRERAFRDPGGEVAHGVLTVRAVIGGGA